MELKDSSPAFPVHSPVHHLLFPNPKERFEVDKPAQILLQMFCQNLQSASDKKTFKAWQQELEGEHFDIKAAFQKLSAPLQSQLRKILGPIGLASLCSLGKEKKPHLFAKSLYRFAFSQEQNQNLSVAVALYRGILQYPMAGPSREQALHRLDLLKGKGPFGDRMEFQGSQWIQQLTDPGLYLGMIAAGGIFPVARFAVQNLFFKLSGIGKTSRILWARALGWAGGALAEAPAFTLTEKGVHQALGIPENWSGSNLFREILSSGIAFTALRASGLGAQMAMGRILKPHPHSGPMVRFSRVAIPQGAMLMGILGAEAIKNGLALSHPSPYPLIDSLVTLLHFNVAGHLLNRLTAGTYARKGMAWENFWEAKFSAKPKGASRISQENLGEKSSMAEWIGSRVTPEGLSPDGLQILNMTVKKDSEMGPAISEVPEPRQSSGIRDKSPVHLLPPYLHHPLRTRLGWVEYQIAGMIIVPSGEALWYHQTSSALRHLRYLTEVLREKIEEHPEFPSFEPYLNRVNADLESMIAATRLIPKSPPFSLENPNVNNWVRSSSGIANQVIAFLIDSSMGSLRGMEGYARKANQSLQELLGLKESFALSPDDLKGILTSQASFNFKRSQPDQLPPKYDYLDQSIYALREILPEGQNVLLLGNLDGLRKEIFTRQKVETLTDPWEKSLSLPLHSKSIDSPPSSLGTKKSSEDFPETKYSYLEAYDIFSREDLAGGTLREKIGKLMTYLQPGGIAYVVSRNPLILTRLGDTVIQYQMAEILEGSLNAPLPVASKRPDAGNSHYLFFRKLPFSAPREE